MNFKRRLSLLLASLFFAASFVRAGEDAVVIEAPLASAASLAVPRLPDAPPQLAAWQAPPALPPALPVLPSQAGAVASPAVSAPAPGLSSVSNAPNDGPSIEAPAAPALSAAAVKGIGELQDAASRALDSLEAARSSADDDRGAGERLARELQRPLGTSRGVASAPAAPVLIAAQRWDAALEESAAELGVTRPTLNAALRAAEREIGTPLRAVMDAAQLKKYLLKDASFKERFIKPLAAMPAPAAGRPDWRFLFSRVAQENDVEPLRLMRWAKDAGLDVLMQHASQEEKLERQLQRLLQRRRLDAEGASWPDNTQGSFMRVMAGALSTSGGKSIEEISRAGAFAYVSFSGRTVVRASAGRDPDERSCDFLFYVEKRGGAWKIGYYPGGANSRPKALSGQEAAREFKRWLQQGIPSLRFSAD